VELKYNRFTPSFVGAISLLLALATLADAFGQQSTPGVYLPNSNGVYELYTGSGDQFWPGIWSKTNDIQEQLVIAGPGTTNPLAVVLVGSRVTNAWGNIFAPANGRYLKFELRDSNQVLVPLRKGISMECKLPQRTSVDELISAGGGHYISSEQISWFTNGDPAKLDVIELRNVFQIESEGNYTLSLCPIIYKRELDELHLDQIALPCLSTNIHLLPEEKPPTLSAWPAFATILAGVFKCAIVAAGLLWVMRHRSRR
jgi:hypothetical protein